MTRLRNIHNIHKRMYKKLYKKLPGALLAALIAFGSTAIVHHQATHDLLEAHSDCVLCLTQSGLDNAVSGSVHCNPSESAAACVTTAPAAGSFSILVKHTRARAPPHYPA